MKIQNITNTALLKVLMLETKSIMENRDIIEQSIVHFSLGAIQ